MGTRTKKGGGVPSHPLPDGATLGNGPGQPYQTLPLAMTQELVTAVSTSVVNK